MIRAFRSEWCKLMRRGELLGAWGTMAGLGLLVTVLLVANAGEPPQQDQFGNTQGGPSIPIALLEGSDGWVFPFRATGQLLGIIALVVAAGNLATEFTSGTLKGLLVREPRRAVLLAGKITAVWTFVVVGIALTLVVTLAAAVLGAAARGIAMEAWASLDGLAALARCFVDVVLAGLMWTLLGTMLAMVFRSGPPAIGIGITYPILVEGLLALALPDLVRWMPGAVLAKVGAGPGASVLGSATPTLDYASALVLGVLYSVVFLAVSVTLLRRRDVV